MGVAVATGQSATVRRGSPVGRQYRIPTTCRTTCSRDRHGSQFSRRAVVFFRKRLASLLEPVAMDLRRAAIASFEGTRPGGGCRLRDDPLGSADRHGSKISRTKDGKFSLWYAGWRRTVRYNPIIDVILASRLSPAEADLIRRALGATPWGRRWAQLDARDYAIRDLAAIVHPGLSIRSAAAAITADLRRHLAGDRQSASPANRHAISRTAKMLDGRVLSVSQIRRIIGGCRTPRKARGSQWPRNGAP